ncbi:hypothetical protein DOTSEDRAFT_28112 [Dothistroma septosporum NZE10]|uniref:2EXR domain-containing protein n=1 Tax=Dothistroma septosporum (strain NZE10 / CBS 128990) TaxID=675120 RepID=N1PG01_DOTSN|nr:hypothetical protein DOTSEDRAFT_28112 [Dothistroma septosporum NZE10]
MTVEYTASIRTQFQGREQSPPEVKPFRFMDLSPELRNKIYSLLLEDDGALTLCHPGSCYRRRRRQRVLGKPTTWSLHTVHPAILRTCMQLHDEATSILYVNNSFEFLDERVSRHFLERIGLSIRYVGYVKVCYNYVKTHLWRILVLLEEATSIQKLETTWDVTGQFGPAKFAKHMGPMMRALHKTRKQMKDYNMESMLDVVVIKSSETNPETVQEWLRNWVMQFKERIGETLK